MLLGEKEYLQGSKNQTKPNQILRFFGGLVTADS